MASHYLLAQKDSLLNMQPVRVYTGNITNFTTDNLGNLYLVNNGNQVKKLNANGDSLAVYNDVKRYGKIYSIDASNPLKILVYFRDFATIVVLDRLLTVRNTIDLRKQNIYQAQAVATSYDGNIWVYDELESKLKKISDIGRILIESADMRQVFEVAPQPTVMYDRDGQLYLYDTSRGLLVFDYYGAQKNNYQLTHVNDLQVLDKNTVTGIKGDRIVFYKPLTLQLYYYQLNQPINRFSKIWFTGSRLYALTNAGTVETFTTL
jgi:hypothetical protein